MSTVEKQAANLLVASPISRKSSRLTASGVQQQATAAGSKPPSRSASLAQRKSSKTVSSTSQVDNSQEIIHRSASTAYANTMSTRAESKVSGGVAQYSPANSNTFSRSVKLSHGNETLSKENISASVAPIISNRSVSNLSKNMSSAKSSRLALQGSNALAFPNPMQISKSASTTSYHLIKPISSLAGSRKGSITRVPVSLNSSRLSTAFQNKLSLNETEILHSSNPLATNETDEIEVFGERGLWINKQDSENWKGDVPLSDYSINIDPNPEIVTKKPQHVLEYVQELAVRYLRPPTPPPAGEIVIVQEPNKQTQPAPPLVIRQQPARPITPEPLVIREAPPQPPAAIGKKLITISGKRLPPPPRKVVIERLAELPSKPPAVLIERWLPYTQPKRKVIFQPAPPDPILANPRNIIVQWEKPDFQIRKEFKYLGVLKANPNEYVQKFGDSLKFSNDLPDFVQEIQTPEGLTLAANYQNNSHDLEGDLYALNLIDIEKEGLGEYREYMLRLGNLESQFVQMINSNEFLSNSSVDSAVASVAYTNNVSLSSSSSSLTEQIPVTSSSSSSVSSSLSRSKQSSRAASAARASSQQSSKATPSILSQRNSHLTSEYSQSRVPSHLSKSSNQESRLRSRVPSDQGSRSGSLVEQVASFSSVSASKSPLSVVVEQIFQTIDRNADGKIDVYDAEKTLLRLNSRLNRSYGEDDVKALFQALDSDKDGLLDINDFKNALSVLKFL